MFSLNSKQIGLVAAGALVGLWAFMGPACAAAEPQGVDGQAQGEDQAEGPLFAPPQQESYLQELIRRRQEAVAPRPVPAPTNQHPTPAFPPPPPALEVPAGEELLPEPAPEELPAFDSPPVPKPPAASQLSAAAAELAPKSRVEFPPLPPDPYAEEQPHLPPLEEELHHHGGSYLYVPEGDGFQEHALEAVAASCGPHGGQAEAHGEHHEPPKRLPEWFQPPQPITCFADYLGADPIQLSRHAWAGPGGYQWEPRFVLHGRYDVFGIAFQENNQRQDGLGHNLTLDADLRLTGTERFHLQHRPIGEDGSGGSFYRFNDDTYLDNSTAEPARVWFEGEIASIFSGFIADPTRALDYNFAVGKFPLGLHNNLLMNDEVAGVIIGKNNQMFRIPGLGPTSNLNTRVFWLFDDVNSFSEFGSDVLGADAFIDFRHAFIETTYAFRRHGRTSDGDAHYLAASATQFFGASTASARALVKIAGPADSDGQLFVLEWSTHRRHDHGFLPRCGVRHGVYYANAFYATKGWSPIAGANFNRIRSSFEVNPLVLIARGDRDDTPGLALGVQLFGEEDDSSLTPEVAWEAPGGVSIFGFGARYQRKTSQRSFLELRGLVNFSDHSPFDRDGGFVSHHWLF